VKKKNIEAKMHGLGDEDIPGGFNLLIKIIRSLIEKEEEIESTLQREINQTDCLQLLIPLLTDKSNDNYI
jgi:hypothetical protein